MKSRSEEMVLFPLDYGDLIRPDFRILPSRGWGQCTNLTGEILVVYGPKSQQEPSIFDNSPYILEPGKTTPDGWDCDGFFLPTDRAVRIRLGRRTGPLAIKYWNFRHFIIRALDRSHYSCSWPNGVYEPSQINWVIPNFGYAEISSRANRIKSELKSPSPE